MALRSTRARIGSTPCGHRRADATEGLEPLVDGRRLVLGEHGLHLRQRARDLAHGHDALAAALADADDADRDAGRHAVDLLALGLGQPGGAGGRTLGEQHHTGAAHGTEHHRGRAHVTGPLGLGGHRLLLVVPALAQRGERGAGRAGLPLDRAVRRALGPARQHERRGQGAQRDADDEEVDPVAHQDADDDHHQDHGEGREQHPPADHGVDRARGGEHLTDLGETSGLLGRVGGGGILAGHAAQPTFRRRRSGAARPARRLPDGRGSRRPATGAPAARERDGPSASSPGPTAGRRGRTSAPAARS